MMYSLDIALQEIEVSDWESCTKFDVKKLFVSLNCLYLDSLTLSCVKSDVPPPSVH